MSETEVCGNEKMPVILEGPELPIIIKSTVYVVFCFLSLPFMLLFVSGEYYDNGLALSWFEIVFHCINVGIVIIFFKSYLADTYTMFSIQFKQMFLFALVIAGVGFAAEKLCTYVLYAMDFAGSDGTAYQYALLARYGTLPMTEMDIMLISGDVVFSIPSLNTGDGPGRAGGQRMPVLCHQLPLVL